jgi:hypothetical protein
MNRGPEASHIDCASGKAVTVSMEMELGDPSDR